MKSWRRVSGYLVVAAAAVSGALLTAAEHQSARPAPEKNQEYVLAGAFPVHCTTLAEMVAASQTVVRGTVDSEERGDVIDEGDVKYTQRFLHLKVKKVLAGKDVGSELTIRTAGWRQVAGEHETEARVEDSTRIIKGNDGVFFLYDADADGLYGFVDDQAVLVVDGAKIRKTTRQDPLVQHLEQLTVADLLEEIGKVKAAIDRKEVKQMPYPGAVR